MNSLSNSLSGSILQEIGSNFDIMINEIGKLLYNDTLLKTDSFPVNDKHKFFDKGFFLNNDEDIIFILIFFNVIIVK